MYTTEISVTDMQMLDGRGDGGGGFQGGQGNAGEQTPQQAPQGVVDDRELCLGLDCESRTVVDCGSGSIESREAAIGTVCQLGLPESKVKELLVHVPTKPPLSEEDRQKDPFSVYGVCGSVFPDGDGDSFLSLCLKAKPDHVTEIRRLLPGFDVIDAIGQGMGWPTLQALLRVESTKEIISALMAPTPAQQTALKGGDAWVAETKRLLESCLDLKLVTRGKSWASIAEELWRFVLFSEFASDLPSDLPDALASIPRAPEPARYLVNSLCEDLRAHPRTQTEYINRAEKIETDLQVAAHCRSIEDLGTRDTFPFEERSYLARAVKALEEDDPDTVRTILENRQYSVWAGNGDSQAQWALLQSASDLIDACERCQAQLSSHTSSQSALIEFYVTQFREVDRSHREFEMAVSDYIDGESVLAPVLDQARSHYKALANSANDVFVRHLLKSGWPVEGYQTNGDVFDKMVAPSLKESGRRVAFLLVDALRYELGVALEHELSDSGKVELQPAMAVLPTVTPVGMSSLLPGAGDGLEIQSNSPGFSPTVKGVKTETVSQRMDVVQKLYGNRFSQQPLQDFLTMTEDRRPDRWHQRTQEDRHHGRTIPGPQPYRAVLPPCRSVELRMAP